MLARLGSQTGPATSGSLEGLLHLLLHIEPLESVLQPYRGIRVLLLLLLVIIVHAVAHARLCAAAATATASRLPPDGLLQSCHPFAERRA